MEETEKNWRDKKDLGVSPGLPESGPLCLSDERASLGAGRGPLEADFQRPLEQTSRCAALSLAHSSLPQEAPITMPLHRPLLRQ